MEFSRFSITLVQINLHPEWLMLYIICWRSLNWKLSITNCFLSWYLYYIIYELGECKLMLVLNNRIYEFYVYFCMFRNRVSFILLCNATSNRLVPYVKIFRVFYHIISFTRKLIVYLCLILLNLDFYLVYG